MSRTHNQWKQLHRLLLLLTIITIGQCKEESECLADGTCQTVSNNSDQPNLYFIKEEASTASSNECGLYLAESTLPDAGVGIFSGREKHPGDVIGVGDVCIPFTEMYWHNDEHFYPNPFRDYFWQGTSMGMHAESDTEDIEAYCPGLDCAVNCNPALLNVGKMTPNHDYAGLRRHIDPGVGAFTPYHNGTTYVLRHIPVGGELFKEYGQNWFDYRKHIFGIHFPLEDSYDAAQELLQKLKHVLPVMNENNLLFAELYKIIASFKNSPWQSRTVNAFPDNYQEALQALQHHDGDLRTTVHQPVALRSIDWLAKHGRCLDHIRPGMSSIPQAGHGAFANHNLPANSIITTSPLHHVPDRKFANLYNFTTTEDKQDWVRIQDQIIGHQLMLNYCFSHKQSTILLCPYGAGINYINHDAKRANVRVRWAHDFSLIHNQSLVDSGYLEDLALIEKPTLAFDYVAMRDITEGEELFLDYGDDWAKAWQQHVLTYKPFPNVKEARHYHDARSWNEQFANIMLRTVDEQEVDPYPPHLQMRCHTGLYHTHSTTALDWTDQDSGTPCRILHRTTMKELLDTLEAEDDEKAAAASNDYIYTVELEHRSSSPSLKTGGDFVTRTIRANVRRMSIAFFDAPMTTNIRLPNAFRHWIGLPDDVLPQQWKNMLNGEPDPLSVVYSEILRHQGGHETDEDEDEGFDEANYDEANYDEESEDEDEDDDEDDY